MTQQQGATLLTHDLFTNNILYFEAALDMKAVPASLLPLVPLFCRSLTQMGTDKESFVELTERIGRKTGGLSVSTMVSSVRGKEEPVAKLMVRKGSQIGLCLGSGVLIQPSPFTPYPLLNVDSTFPTQVRGKAMASKAGDMMEVARDVLLTARLDDQARFTQVWEGMRYIPT